MALVSADTSAEIKNITLDRFVRPPLRQAAGTLSAILDSACIDDRRQFINNKK
jgi:hypothetical protein